MAGYGDTVSKQIARYGEPCTIIYPAVGLGSTQQPATTVKTSIRITERKNAAGTFETIGTLGPTKRSLEGAQIATRKKTYNVAAVTERIVEGMTFLQRVRLS